MFCKHNYVYTQGHFYCTKCHHRTHKEKYGKLHGRKKAIVITGVIISGIIGFMFVNGVFKNNQENLIESINNLPVNIKESIKNIQENLPKNTPVNTSITPFPSYIIGQSTFMHGIEYTILNIQRSETGSTEFSYYIYIDFKIVNHNLVDKGWIVSPTGDTTFRLKDQRSTPYVGHFIAGQNQFKPEIPVIDQIRFEVPKDESLQFTLFIPGDHWYQEVIFGVINP